jgi:hypothetical protein
MTSLPDMLWGSIGSLGMLGYEVTRSLMSLRGVALFEAFRDLSLPWGSLDEMYSIDSIVG